MRFIETPHGVAVKIGFGLLTVVMPPRAVCRQFAVATGADVRWLFFIFIRINLFFKFYFSNCNKHVLHKCWCPWTVCFAQSTFQIGYRRERVLAKPFTVHVLWEMKENDRVHMSMSSIRRSADISPSDVCFSRKCISLCRSWACTGLFLSFISLYFGVLTDRSAPLIGLLALGHDYLSIIKLYRSFFF